MRTPDIRWFESVRDNDVLPTLTHRPDAVQLFRFSAATHNSHRIHFDQAYAQRVEGYPDIVVQAHLHGALMVQTVTRWAGPHGRIRRFSWTNRRFTVPGQTLQCGGSVTATYVEDGTGLVRCELAERLETGELCAPGWALVELPRQKGAP